MTHHGGRLVRAHRHLGPQDPQEQDHRQQAARDPESHPEAEGLADTGKGILHARFQATRPEPGDHHSEEERGQQQDRKPREDAGGGRFVVSRLKSPDRQAAHSGFQIEEPVVDRRGAGHGRHRHHENHDQRGHPCDEQPGNPSSTPHGFDGRSLPSSEHDSEQAGGRDGEVVDRVKSEPADRRRPPSMSGHETEEFLLEKNPGSETDKRDDAERDGRQTEPRHPRHHRQDGGQGRDRDRKDRDPRPRRPVHRGREGGMGRDRPPPGDSPGEEIGLPEADRGPGLQVRPVRLGNHFDRSLDRTQPKPEFHVLDRGATERRVEPADRMKRITPDRAESRPESGDGISSLLMDQMVPEIRIGGGGSRGLGPVVVGTDGRGDHGVGACIPKRREQSLNGVRMDEYVGVDEDDPGSPCGRGGEISCDAGAHGRIAGAEHADPWPGLPGQLHRAITRGVVDEDQLGRIAGGGPDRIDAPRKVRSSVMDRHDHADVEGRLRRLRRQRPAPGAEASRGTPPGRSVRRSRTRDLQR